MERFTRWRLRLVLLSLCEALGLGPPASNKRVQSLGCEPVVCGIKLRSETRC